MFACEKYNHRNFVSLFGFSLETLQEVFDKTRFQNFSDLKEFLYYFAYMKDYTASTHEKFHISNQTFYTKAWNAAKYLERNLNEVSIKN